jgi:hypothetical protein
MVSKIYSRLSISSVEKSLVPFGMDGFEDIVSNLKTKDKSIKIKGERRMENGESRRLKAERWCDENH